MWHMIPSLQPFVEFLQPAFTQPSSVTSASLLLAWIMCLGPHTLRRVAQTAQPNTLPDPQQRHGLDTTYNFYARSAWTPTGLAYHVALLLFTRWRFLGRITLLVDDTLAHKRGVCVWGLGWWRDAVASTKKRVATASGHNWVVLAVAYCLPGTQAPILALPLLARLHQAGKDQPSCPTLAREMLREVLGWFPQHTFTLVGDGAYACKELLADLDARVTFVGRLRGDAAVYDPQPPQVQPGRRGPKPKKGARWPSPKQAAAKADRKRSSTGAWLWQTVSVLIYGSTQSVQALSYEVVWPHVLGLRRVLIVVVRDPAGRLRDGYFFTTDLEASLEWVIVQFAWRWSIEVLFRSSKQVMDIEAPQHWCQESVEKVAPWVWSMQSVIMVWYIEAGQHTSEAAALREQLGEWDSEWSLRHMIKVLRYAILENTITSNSTDPLELQEMIRTLKNYVNLAA